MVVEHAKGDGCVTQSLILLGLVDNRIATEQRLSEIASAQRCHGDRFSEAGWWTGLKIPLPLEDQVTSELTVPGGSAIEIINGGPNLDRLALWGLDHFATAGLSPPRIESITFAPVPACATVAGVISERPDGPPDLVLCIDEYQSCLPAPATCLEFTLSARLGLLHEMAHVWLIQNLTDEERGHYLDWSSLIVWRDAETPWHLRAVENAAETLAWGLMDVPVQLARLGNPTCESLSAGELLTGSRQTVACAEVP